MAELTPKEHLQPSLLDRLTDSNPGRETDALEQRIMSLRQLRESVIRDLEWLLNTGRLEISRELSGFQEAGKSVLNYGIPNLSGISVTHKDSVAIERDIRQAIVDFEPRILPGTLKVNISLINGQTSENTLVLEIQGELWWQPLPERFYLKATLDSELGKFKRSAEP
ncbi:MAG: type VI secretion system baseplate subunit TssE [Syntrophobacteraceae bacterium]|nr:type VI secretion system baseplate subunit TssE [Syntrophobacteraceae bacterium]